MRDCTFSKLCMTCPEIEPVTAIPPKTITSPNVGWNAGANSVTTLDGDVHTVMGAATGIAGSIVGFRTASDKRPPVSPVFVTHGIYFFTLHTNTAVSSAMPIESAQQISAQQLAYAAGDTFEIRRVNKRVVYLHNDEVWYESTTESHGLIRVMCCLYAAGDNVQ